MMESEAKRLALEQLYRDNFKPEEYLSTYYRTLDAEVEFFLRNLHHFFFVSNGKASLCIYKINFVKRGSQCWLVNPPFILCMRRIYYTRPAERWAHTYWFLCTHTTFYRSSQQRHEITKKNFFSNWCAEGQDFLVQRFVFSNHLMA